MPELLLGLDVGTTSARAALFTPAFETLSLVRAPLVSVSPGPGRVEQDAQGVWRTARRLISKALATAGRTAADLAAIGVTSQRTSIVAWDRRTGAPLGPMVVWSDLRGAGRAERLREAGFPIVAQHAAAKLEGVLAGVRDAGADLAWGPVDSFLIFKLSGGAAHVTDRSQAWPTGYLDLATMGWNRALLDHQGLYEAAFPTLVDTWGPLAVSDRRQVGAAVPIAADIADQQSALMAHGQAAGVAKISFGTSATLDLSTGTEFVFRSPSVPPFVLSSVAGETRFCLESMVLSAGSALDFARRMFALGGHGAFAALAAQAADSGGAAFLPALNGLGAPYGDPARRALLAGLGPETGRPQIARAVLEGAAFRVREAFEHLYGLVDIPPPAALGVDGGLSSSDFFLQIQADLLGRPVRRHAVPEATALGAALCAGRGVGLTSESDAAGAARYGATFKPRIDVAQSAERFSVWKEAVYGEAA